MHDSSGLTRRRLLVDSARLASALGIATCGHQAGAAQGRESAAAGGPMAKLHIDPAREAVRYDRMVFGQFIEHFHREVYGGVFDPGSRLADRRGFRKDVIEALRELRVPVMRWPGGCFASAYHWTDGVGPDRRGSYDKAWRVEDPNTFGTNEFVAWCREIEAEPYICTNGGTGTSEEASNWVEYCNLDVGRWAAMRRSHGIAKPHDVKYWSIGNENYGPWEMGAKSAPEWAAFVRETAKMMRRVDPSIKLLAPATSSPRWTEPLLREAGRYLDYLSVHGYWDPLWQRDRPSAYAACMAWSLEPEKLITQAEHLLTSAGLADRMRIAVDEWNLRGWHHPDGNSPEALKARDRNDINATYTMGDAVFSAVFLNTCLRHPQTVGMANMAPTVNGRGPLFVHPRGVVRRTTFHVLAMYAQRLLDHVLEAETESDSFQHANTSIPALDAVVTCDEGRGKLVAALVNRDPERDLECTIRIAGRFPNGVWPAAKLAGDSTDAFNDVARPDRVVPEAVALRCARGRVTLPAHSVTICEVPVR